MGTNQGFTDSVWMGTVEPDALKASAVAVAVIVLLARFQMRAKKLAMPCVE